MSAAAFRYHLHPELPRLAWLAQFERGAATVVVHHGPWVEVRPDGFIEGIWDGPYEAEPLANTPTVIGTGARSMVDGWLVIGPSNRYDRLYHVRIGDHWYVSNSMVFLLAWTDDRPDPAHDTYFHDLLEHNLSTPDGGRSQIVTEKRRPVYMDAGVDLQVDRQLRARMRKKPSVGMLRNYADYAELLEDTLARMFENAAAPARSHVYEPLTMVSRGFDSPAIASVSSRLGCKHALTIADEEADNGTPVAEALGLECHEFKTLDYQSAYLQGETAADDFPEAEFCSQMYGPDVILKSVESRLEGKLVCTGRSSVCWDKQPHDVALRVLSPWAAAGAHSMTEFRLRVGCFSLPAAFIGNSQPAALLRITHSAEMAPWTLGGKYDVPIARRLAEERGVPRELFGQEKFASAHTSLDRPARLLPHSRADYEAFVAAECHGGRAMQRMQTAALRALYRGSWAVTKRVTGQRPRLLSPRHAWDALRNHLCHWGFARTKPRYESALAARGAGDSP